MPANSSINLASLDFDTNKNNLKTWLKSQSELLDYDYDSSTMSVILDLLSYNTFQMAFYLNMIASEAFLDSAQLRNSIMSHAKELNYVPRSMRSAKATVNINFTSNTNIVTLPKGTSFTSLVGSNLLTFITDRETVYFSSNGTFAIQNLDIYEGKLVTETITIDYENTAQRFIITDPNIDTRSLSVQIIEDNTGTVLNYSLATTTLDLNENSKIYFLQGAEDNKFEIVFGDNIIGRRPKDGAILILSYRRCSGLDGNGASLFTLDTAFANFATSPTVATVNISNGGDEQESNDSIKFYAPRAFQTQERAVNTNDYEIILKQQFPEINAIAAYGGEELNPPQYGKVFIAVDISDVDGLPQSKIDEYYNYIKPRSPLSIIPQFIVPEYLYYAITSVVNYDVTATNLTKEQIKSEVVQTIINYHNTHLNNFKSSFRYSKFIAEIDSITDAGILGNDTDVRIYKKLDIQAGTTTNIDVSFGVPLTTTGSNLGTQYSSDDLVTIESDPFILNGETVYLSDDNDGTVRIIKVSGTNKLVVIPSIGTIDYSTGLVKLNNFKIDAYQLGENSLRIYAITASKDFETSQNVILALEPNKIDVTVNSVVDLTQNLV